MKKILFLMGIVYSADICAEFDFSSYQPSTLTDITEKHEKHLAFGEENEISVSGTIFKFRVNAVFTKQLRKIGKERKYFLRAWVRSVGQPESFLALYKHEFLVEENGVQYWVPMQEKVLPYMGTELEVGETFQLYIVLAGRERNQMVFLGTEFQKIPPDKSL